MAEQFTETTTTLAAFAGCLPETVRLYGKLGLLDSMRLPSGVQLFKRSDAAKVRQIMAERLKRRGGGRRAEAAT
jgi:DNA-binding transcriptional MerR regulator